MKRHRHLLVGAAMALFACVAISSPAMATACTNLRSLQLPHTVINSADDNTTGTFVPPGASPITGLPAFCRVTATLVPSSDSSIRIEVWLPESNWNGRFLGTGGGGFQGVITYNELAIGIKAGFAATNSDLGTGSSGCNPLFCGSAGNMGNPLAIQFGDPASPSAGLFGHPERIKDFGYRAIHLMTVRGKEIANLFYGQRPQRAYFAGCSTGGQNALMEAQRFPNDYDGILAGAPGLNLPKAAVQHAWDVQSWQMADRDIRKAFSPADMQLVAAKVLERCDLGDGAVDGIGDDGAADDGLANAMNGPQG